MSNRWTTKDIKNIRHKVVTGLPDDYVSDGVEITTKRKNNKHEQKLQIQIATYMKLKHPEIIFYSDVASGCKLTIGQTMLNKRMQYSRALPDMFIAHTNRTCGGLFLELKKSKDQVCRKDGTIRKNEHIQEQAEMLRKLQLRGYKAVFACGFDESVNIIEEYLKIK